MTQPVGTGNTSAQRASSVFQTVSQIGTYDPIRDRAQQQRRKTRQSWGIAVILGLLTLGVNLLALNLLLNGFSLGAKSAMVGALSAFAPMPIYLMLWLWLDRNDPEPPWAVALAFFWGGGVAILAAGFANGIFSEVVANWVSRDKAQILTAVLCAPIIEEFGKALGVLLFFIFMHDEFDGVTDGVVYAGVIALGFATCENVEYYGASYQTSGVKGLFGVVLVRGVMSPFLHSIFTSMTGIGFDIARDTGSKAVKIFAPVAGYLLAVSLHMLWNGLCSFLRPEHLLLAYFLFWFPLFIVFVSFNVYLGFREGRIIREMLEQEVTSGMITREHQTLASSWTRRITWLASSVVNGERFLARRRYIRAVTRLALCHYHVFRAEQVHGKTMSLPRLPDYRGDVIEWRDKI